MVAALNLQGLRALVQQHLTAALDELFGNLQKTFTEYDQEISRQRRLLDLLTETRALYQADRSDPSLDLLTEKRAPYRAERSDPSLDLLTEKRAPYRAERSDTTLDLLTEKRAPYQADRSDPSLDLLTEKRAPYRAERSDPSLDLLTEKRAPYRAERSDPSLDLLTEKRAPYQADRSDPSLDLLTEKRAPYRAERSDPSLDLLTEKRAPYRAERSDTTLDLLTETRAPHRAESSVPSPAESVHSSRSDPRTRTPGTEGSSLCMVAVKTEEQVQGQYLVQNPLQIRVHSPVQDQDQVLNPVLLTPVQTRSPDLQQDGLTIKAETSHENEMELDSDLVLDYDPLMLLVPDPEDPQDPRECDLNHDPGSLHEDAAAFRNHEDGGFSSPRSDLQVSPVSFSLREPHSWVQTFQIPWERISPSLSLSMSRGERAGARDRRVLVRAVVDAMRQRCANPTRSACVEVAKMIVSNHPMTFADRTEEGEQLGTGYFSLLNQLKSRVDNLNRGGRVPLRRRRPRASCSAKKASTCPQTLQRSKKHSYGCVNWQPALPQDESSSSLENKRKEMVELLAACGAGAAETPQVAELMALTYALQRRIINSSPVLNAAAVRAQFPFLFTKSCLNEHFQTLTGVDLLPRLREALLTKGARIRTFFWRQNRDQHQTREQTRALLRLLDWTDTDQRQTGLSAVLLVMKHFLEREEAIFVRAEPNASKASIESSVSLPVAPRIIAVGDSVLASRCWMVSLDRAVVFESESSFADALSVFFCCFYVFNLEYEEPACATLELIQRYFAQINPAEGTKCTAKTGVSRKTGETVARKAETVNCRVASFLRQLSLTRD